MEISKTKSVGEFVVDDYRTAAVFQKYSIDYCNKSDETIEAVSKHKNISIDELLTHLRNISDQSDSRKIDFQSWPLDMLAVYIEKKFHRYFDQITPVILQSLDKLCELHGNQHPELFEINELFNAAAGELAAHMKREEFIVFPFIRKMVNARNNPGSPGWSPLISVQHPIKMMRMEHDIEGDRFKKISSLCDNYNPPADASTFYKATFSLLKEFEDDLHMHIHLENNILYPKAVELKKKLNS